MDNQYEDIKQIVESLKPKVKDDVVVNFYSSNIESGLVNYRFPINYFNENKYLAIKALAQLDYILRFKNGESVTDSTKLIFKDRNNIDLDAIYDFKHSKEFFDKLEHSEEKTL